MEDEPIKEAVTDPETVNPAPEHVNPPVTDAKDTHLEDRVSALETLVGSIVSGKGPDSTPVSKPWTHRGGGQ